MTNSSIKTATILGALAVLGLAGCSTPDALQMSQEYQQGYIIDEEAVAATPVGSSREQVQLTLGSPSIERDFGQGETYYYISQTRRRPVAFAGRRLVDQRVLAVSFNDEGRVSRIANYGLKDGRLFDFIGEATPTGGSEATFIGGIISGLGSRPGTNPLGG